MDVKEKVKEFILTEICEDLGMDISNIGEDESLIRAGIMDSLGILKTLSFLDEEYEISLPREMIKPDTFENIKIICELIEKQKSQE